MKNTIFLLITILFTVLLAELTLKAACFISPRVAYELRPPWSNRALDLDPDLGYRVSPFYPGSDSRGYRNKVALEDTDILGIGDSMTYGYSVLEQDSWPAVISRQQDLKVYNAGVGGYGPCEYQQVAAELTELSPKTVIVSLYLGNDISDAYTSVYLEDRCEDMRSDDSQIIAELDRLRAEQTLKKQAVDLGLKSVPEPFRDGLPLSHQFGTNLRDKSSLFSLFRTIYHRMTAFQYGRFGENTQESYDDSLNLPGAVPYNAVPEIRTVFKNPSVDVLAVDQSDLRIREGRRVTEDSLLNIRTIMTSANNFVVVIIPTKAVAYADLLDEEFLDSDSGFIHKLKNEQRLKTDFIRYFDDNDIAYIDTTSILSDSLKLSLPTYHESSNEHPNELGYKLIAGAISDTLEL